MHRTLCEDELKGIPILIFCNKQDLPNAMSTAEITDALKLPLKLRWVAQACCATTGDGLFEGMDWLSQELTKKMTTTRVSPMPALKTFELGNKRKKKGDTEAPVANVPPNTVLCMLTRFAKWVL